MHERQHEQSSLQLHGCLSWNAPAPSHRPYVVTDGTLNLFCGAVGDQPTQSQPSSRRKFLVGASGPQEQRPTTGRRHAHPVAVTKSPGEEWDFPKLVHRVSRRKNPDPPHACHDRASRRSAGDDRVDDNQYRQFHRKAFTVPSRPHLPRQRDLLFGKLKALPV